MTPYLRSILLDAEPLSLLARGSRSMQSWAEVARRTDAVLHASTITLTGVADGSARDADVRRVAKAVRLEPVSEAIGYRAGQLRGHGASSRRKKRDMTVDAVVAATALLLPGPVLLLTSDPDDLRLLLGDSGVSVERV